MACNHTDQLALGTAMWGWTIDKITAFALLDDFYQSGCRILDAATNYPINKQPGDFRKAENILLQWIHAHGITDLKVMMKIGSLNNMRSPDNNLNTSFLLMCLDEYKHKFGSNLWSLMVHWDNREDADAIQDTLDILAYAAKSGLQPGLSGIKYPGVYAEANSVANLDLMIQIKHNLIQSDYERYAPFHGKRHFWAYGINAGGVKPNTADYNQQSSLFVRGGNLQTPALFAHLEHLLKLKDERIRSIFDVNLLFALNSPDIAGIIAGPSKVAQWRYTLESYDNLRNDADELYRQILTIKAEFDAA